MKLNHVSTFSGEGQSLIYHSRRFLENHSYRNEGCLYATNEASCIFRPEGNMPFFLASPAFPYTRHIMRDDDFRL